MNNSNARRGHAKMAAPLIAVAVMVSACTNGRKDELSQHLQDPSSEPQVSVSETPYLVRAGDELNIKFFYNPELNETVLVRPDGRISMQLVDEVEAAGKTPMELDELLTQAYSQELRNPAITVIVVRPSRERQQVWVGGEVGRPGIVDLVPDMTPLQAVINANGFRDTADLGEVVLIRRGDDGRPIPFRMDLQSALYGQESASGFLLQPQDVIYVPKTRIAELNLFVQQYIRDLILFRGSGFSFSLGVDRAFDIGDQ